MITTVFADIRFGVRTFLKAPAFTAPVVTTIALAVGATTAIFAVADSIVLRPLPFFESERVVALCETNPVAAGWCGASPMNVADWARMTPALDSAGVARSESVIAMSDSENYAVRGGIASPGFFRVLRAAPLLGRGLEDRDLPGGSNHVAVLSHDFWRLRFAGDPAIVGRSLVLDQTPYTIIGVMPADSWLPGPLSEVQIWKPLTASVDNVANRSWRGFTAIGRMADGVSRERLRTELGVVHAQLASAYSGANRDWGLNIVGLREHTVGDARPTLWIFLASAACVLLIACGNVAGLLLVRMTARTGEFAVRASLGAGRRRLVQQLMTENVLLSLLGGALGLLLAVWATAAFVAVAPASIPRLDEVGIDRRIVLFAFGLATLTAVIFGLAPLRRAWRTDLTTTLRGIRSGDAGDYRLRSAFVVLQLSLALVLLFGAGLLTRGFARLMQWDPGFDRRNVVTTWMLPPKVGGGGATVNLMEQVRDAVATLPGVEQAALGSAGPLFGGEETGRLQIQGRRDIAPDEAPSVQWFDIDPYYVDALGIRILRGRGLASTDTAVSAPVALVNDALVRRFFPAESPLGREVIVQGHVAAVVGVVADVKPLRADQPTGPQIYWPIQQFRRGAAYLILRTNPAAGTVERSVKARTATIDPRIQLSTLVTLDDQFAKRMVSPRFNMLLLAAFALVAVLMSAVGAYGLNASVVESRTHEFGVRLALGASSGQLARSVILRGMSLAAIGIVCGCAGALMAGALLTSLIYGVPARDPWTLTASAALLTVVAAAACWLPARRASHADAVAALRAP